MNADCSFRIGRDHAVCQDYGVARSGEVSFVILADGCSSSPDTDVGARLLVRCAEKLLPDWLRSAGTVAAGVRGFHRRVVLAAREHAAGLGLDARCLDATLLTVAAGEGRWIAMLYGDGVLAIGERSPEGEPRARIRSVSFLGGYPDYPSYLADVARRRAFERLPGNARSAENWLLTADGLARDEDFRPGELVEGCYVETGAAAAVDWIAVLTDGASSFTVTDPGERTSGRVPLPDVLRELLAFKSLSGVFVQRRVQRFLKDCEARGRQHHDDLGVGAIVLR